MYSVILVTWLVLGIWQVHQDQRIEELPRQMEATLAEMKLERAAFDAAVTKLEGLTDRLEQINLTATATAHGGTVINQLPPNADAIRQISISELIAEWEKPYGNVPRTVGFDSAEPRGATRP